MLLDPCFKEIELREQATLDLRFARMRVTFIPGAPPKSTWTRQRCVFLKVWTSYPENIPPQMNSLHIDKFEGLAGIGRSPLLASPSRSAC